METSKTQSCLFGARWWDVLSCFIVLCLVFILSVKDFEVALKGAKWGIYTANNRRRRREEVQACGTFLLVMRRHYSIELRLSKDESEMKGESRNKDYIYRKMSVTSVEK